MKSIEIKAPAKVNILLKVLGKRDDGFHDLEMVMAPLSLADAFSLELIPSGIEFFADGESDAGMEAEKNLAYRAAALLLDETKVRSGVRITLKKQIPVAAGLGGGSSDAAAVLRGLNSLWSLDFSPEKLAALGKRLGADVPFFCFGGAGLVEGIGEKVTPYKTFPNIPFLLINPGFAVPTPWVYGQWDLGLTPKPHNARVPQFFKDLGDVVKILHNDLEAVTIPAYPEIGEIKGIMTDAGALGALMSGSGPTVFGVFEDVAQRDRAAASIKVKKNWRMFAAEAVNCGQSG